MDSDDSVLMSHWGKPKDAKEPFSGAEVFPSETGSGISWEDGSCFAFGLEHSGLLFFENIDIPLLVMIKKTKVHSCP